MGNNTRPAVPVEFISQLHIERDTLRVFITLLETEQQALLESHIEQLPALTHSKTQAVYELNKLASARRNNSPAHSVGIEPGGMETWLQTHAADNLPVWRDIRQLIAHAQQLNRTNGELIQVKLLHNQQALTVLHNAARSTNGLYGPDGQPNLTTSGRTLGSG